MSEGFFGLFAKKMEENFEDWSSSGGIGYLNKF